MSDLIEKLKKVIAEEFDGVSGDHGLDHTMNVYHNAIHIAKKEKADLEVVKAAALLHDIGRREEAKSKGKLNHAVIGAKKAQEILKKFKSDSAFIEKVYYCVLRHRTRDNNHPQSKEEKVIYDADKLDSSGATGIGRAFMWAGKVGARIHNNRPDISLGAEYGPEDTAYREFTVKLKHIKDRMMTKEGKRLAKRRHQFMVNFFKEINHEMSGKT